MKWWKDIFEISLPAFRNKSGATHFLLKRGNISTVSFSQTAMQSFLQYNEFLFGKIHGRKIDLLAEYIDNGNINVVYIATPHTLHHGQVMKCLQHRIAVLCEKPLTINEIQCKELVDTARVMQTFLMGKIVSIRASMGYKAPPDPENHRFLARIGWRLSA